VKFKCLSGVATNCRGSFRTTKEHRICVNCAKIQRELGTMTTHKEKKRDDMGIFEKVKVLALLLLATTAAGNDKIGLGASYLDDAGRTRTSLSVGDMHYFYQVPGKMGIVRYGYGLNKFNVGNGIGIDIQSYGGSCLLPVTEGLGPQIGLDFANMWLRADTNTRSYYGWAPGLSVGPQWALGTTKFLVLAKAGGYAGNIGMGVFWPQFRASYGAAAYVNADDFTASFDSLWFGQFNLRAADLYYNFSPWLRIGLHGESLDGIQSLGVLFKSDLL
jgi:hypothetical protein